MKNLLSFCATFFFCCLIASSVSTKTFSDEIDDLTKQINDLTSAMNMSIKATQPLESELKAMQKQIDGIKLRVTSIENDVAAKKAHIDNGYKDLATQESILEQTLTNYYIQSHYDSPLLTFLSADSASDITRVLAYQKATADKDKAILTNIALSIQDLETKKKELEDEQQKLSVAKANLDEQSAKLDKIVQGAKTYQKTLSTQIAQLSAKQQQLLAQKLGSLGLPTSAYTTLGGCSSDLDIDPGFSPRFALFSFGVPHRVGMSQYGAKGRADAGQNTDTILRAYYNFDSYQNMNATIRVNDGRGFNTGNIIWTGELEEYVKRIYEVPDNWPMDVLKAQAIAARSYVLATTHNGDMSICATQDCQVFKTESKGGNWDNAVNQTAGQVMIQGGNPIQAWFSSTAGGYAFSSGAVWGGEKSWTKNMLDANGPVNSFDDLKNNAYDKESKWFYCDWGARAQYNKTAWLKPEELADIANTVKLAQITNQDQNITKHLLQLDKANSDGNWDESKVKEELQSRGVSPLSSVSNVSISADFGSGKTTTISFNNGAMSFVGDFFKTYFNLRAPSNINIVGPLYNVERK